MNKEIEAIEIALITLTGFIAQQFPDAQLGEFLAHTAHEFSKNPGAERTATLLTALADSATRAEVMSRRN